MAKDKEEVIDSQFVAENVGFLDSCFDNSFSLQTSVVAAKLYIAEESNVTKLPVSQSSKKTQSFHNATIGFNSTIHNSSEITSQLLKSNTIVHNNLKDWGLPDGIARKYQERGIKEMFDWQVACLKNPKVLIDCCNLVYSAPTSAGKTLVAEILTIKTVLERQKKVVIILPFVSIVREKMFYLQDIFSSSGIRVEGFMGAQSPPGGLQAVHVAVCTIEKANSLVNRLLDDGNVSELGAVIVDELHLLGDPHRGYLLELLLTKIKYVNMKSDGVKIQVIGMSATLPNLKQLACWLGAELFVTQFRPIPLDEFCLVGDKMFDKNGQIAKLFSGFKLVEESDNVLKICLMTIEDRCSVLIFCMTKNRCENLAQSIASSFYKMGCVGTEIGLTLRQQLDSEKITEVLEQLKNSPVGLDQVLKKTISFGVAYHHAGLTFDERDIIEGGFKSGAIRVLVATSTLSSGVNLPARKVIIRSPVFQRQPINILTYKQMIGRAGRMGKDVKGESILICTEAEKQIGFNLMMGALDPVVSCIERDDKYMRAILEIIASQVACTKDELKLYTACTLLFTQHKAKSLLSTFHLLLESTLKCLQESELVRTQDNDNKIRFVATPLGKACLSSSMAPNDGLSLFCELQGARQCLVLDTDLHLIYLVTPYSVSSQWGDIDWLHLLNLWESLTRSMKRVGELVGVQESFIIRNVRGTSTMTNAEKLQNKLNIHKRFYTALALQDLVNEVPLSEVAAKFQCARGFLQSLQQAAATFAGMVTAFCHQLGWNNMEMLISQFQDRLHFGIHSELLDLMKLPSLNGMRARSLFDAGFETITSIASADVNLIENALHKAVPFESDKEREGDDNDDIRRRKKLKSVWITGCCGMTTKEAAENLISESRKYLEHEIGVTEIKWTKPSNSNVTEGIPGSDSVISLNSNVIGIINTQEDLNEILYEYNYSIPNVLKTRHGKEDDIEKVEKKTVNKISDICKTNIIIIESGSSSRTSSPLPIKQIYIPNEGGSPPLPTDEILWESLNFTDAALKHDSKVRKSDPVFTPNISLSDNENNTVIQEDKTLKFKSVKDISLFSSDGETSSLFNESLPIDFISCKLLYDRNAQVEKVINLHQQETESDFANVNSETILNAFKSTIVETADNENTKLVYDDDNTVSSDQFETGFNLSDYGIEEFETQQIVQSNFKSPLKRGAINISKSLLKPSAKKVKLSEEHIPAANNAEYVSMLSAQNILDVSKSALNLIAKSNPTSKSAQSQRQSAQTETSKLNQSSLFRRLNISKNSEHFTLKVHKRNLQCIVLKHDDILKNIATIENLQEVSIYIDLQKKHVTHEVIGSNLFRESNAMKQEKSLTKNNKDIPLIKGVAIYFGRDTCLFIDFTSLNEKDVLAKSRFASWLKEKVKLILFNFKSTFVYIKKYFGIELLPTCVDISLAAWLMDSDIKQFTIIDLMKKYCQKDIPAVNLLIAATDDPKRLDTSKSACMKAWCVWEVANEMRYNTQMKSLESHLNLEIKVSRILAKSEICGLVVDKDLTSQLLIDVKNLQEILEKKAFNLCGYRFNFNSTKSVAKALGIDSIKKVSTKKSVLTAHDTPMSSVVIFWRKLNCMLTKTLYPLTEQACIYSTGDRINPSYVMYTCTGRISMQEPNLQNVPRTFSIPANYLYDSKPSDDIIELNCRNIFKAATGNVLVSADYCQLEMRILTHFCRDEVLTNIMWSDVDVFKSIAASWGNVPEDEVDDDLRQKAKQLCYGILYGMCNKTLAHQLDVCEMEAAIFMDTFYKTYPAIKTYTCDVVRECEVKGYVETLLHRRRYLPDINSKELNKRSTAKRQAVNTTIQGSAADIAKMAMCAVDEQTAHLKPCLILQMHDELIYEVPASNANRFAKSLKKIMENTVELNVPLPVKVKAGKTWGALEEIQY